MWKKGWTGAEIVETKGIMVHAGHFYGPFLVRTLITTNEQPFQDRGGGKSLLPPVSTPAIRSKHLSKLIHATKTSITAPEQKKKNEFQEKKKILISFPYSSSFHPKV